MFNDADIQMAQLERQGARAAAARKRGQCAHGRRGHAQHHRRLTMQRSSRRRDTKPGVYRHWQTVLRNLLR